MGIRGFSPNASICRFVAAIRSAYIGAAIGALSQTPTCGKGLGLGHTLTGRVFPVQQFPDILPQLVK